MYFGGCRKISRQYMSRFFQFECRLHECGLLISWRCGMITAAHDSCGEWSNNHNDNLALDDEWLFAAVFFYFNTRCYTSDWNHIHWSLLLLTPLLDRFMCDLVAVLSVLNDVSLEASCCCCCIRSSRFIVMEHWYVCHSSLCGHRVLSLVDTQYTRVI